MTKINIVHVPSPNFNARPKGTEIDTIVIHHTEMSSAKSSLELLCSPASNVSSHYLISADGVIFQLVDENKRAWHAGKSWWRGKSDLNNNSIGIELDNNGVAPFSAQQMKSLIWLCHETVDRNPVKAHSIVAHADIAPNRKVDPNHHFKWKDMAESNLGIYSNVTIANVKSMFKYGDCAKEILDIKTKLKLIGYYLDLSNDYTSHSSRVEGEMRGGSVLNIHKRQVDEPNLEVEEVYDRYDKQLMNIVHAFKRHYVPETYGNTYWDTLCQARLDDLALLYTKFHF